MRKIFNNLKKERPKSLKGQNVARRHGSGPAAPAWLPPFETWAIRLLPVFYLVGLAGHLLPRFFPLMIALTPFTLLGTAIIGFLPWIADTSEEKRKLLLLWAAITFLVTFLLESLGVATGAVFGSYEYGSTLGFQFFGVPVLIGINWTLVILGTLALVERFTSSTPLIVAVTALVTVAFDFIMEPVAIALDYWAWEGGPIPLQNYIAWGLISLVFAALFKALRLESTKKLPLIILLTQTVFFAGLRIFVV